MQVSSRTKAGVVFSWRTEKTNDGFCFIIYAGKCKRKTNDAAAKLSSCETGEEALAVLGAAVRVRKSKKVAVEGGKYA